MKMDFTNPRAVAQAIAEGHSLTFAEAAVLADAPLSELQEGANFLRRKFLGDKSNLCSIINARSGLCPEDCRYCAQSVHYKTACSVHPLVSGEEALALAKENENAGAKRFSLVTSGRCLSNEDFAAVLDIIRLLKRETGLAVCASLGFLTTPRANALFEAGLSFYHHNLESSREFFAKTCTTHTFEDRVKTVKLARTAGLKVCCGGIFGLGESRQDRLSMAFSIRDLGAESVPLNVLNPIPGTPLENVTPVRTDEVLRCMALYRFILPGVSIRFAGGRELLGGDGIVSALNGGVDSAISGDMLTTSGAKIRSDLELFAKCGCDCTWE